MYEGSENEILSGGNLFQISTHLFHEVKTKVG